jgi:hypothetical protein
MAVNGHLPSEIFLAYLEDRMSRVDHITVEGKKLRSWSSWFNCRPGGWPIWRSARRSGGYSYYIGGIAGRGWSSVAARIRSSEPAVDGQVTSSGWGNCGSGDTWSLNFPQCSFKKLPQPSERFLKTLPVVNGFEVERLLEYLAFVLKIRRLARVWGFAGVRCGLSVCSEPLAESLLAAWTQNVWFSHFLRLVMEQESSIPELLTDDSWIRVPLCRRIWSL